MVEKVETNNDTHTHTHHLRTYRHRLHHELAVLGSPRGDTHRAKLLLLRLQCGEDGGPVERQLHLAVCAIQLGGGCGGCGERSGAGRERRDEGGREVYTGVHMHVEEGRGVRGGGGCSAVNHSANSVWPQRGGRTAEHLLTKKGGSGQCMRNGAENVEQRTATLTHSKHTLRTTRDVPCRSGTRSPRPTRACAASHLASASDRRR